MLGPDVSPSSLISFHSTQVCMVTGNVFQGSLHTLLWFADDLAEICPALHCHRYTGLLQAFLRCFDHDDYRPKLNRLAHSIYSLDSLEGCAHSPTNPSDALPLLQTCYSLSRSSNCNSFSGFVN